MGIFGTNWRKKREALDKAAKYAGQLASIFRIKKRQVDRLKFHIALLERTKKIPPGPGTGRGDFEELKTAMENFSSTASGSASFFRDFKKTIKNVERTKENIKSLKEKYKDLKKELKVHRLEFIHKKREHRLTKPNIKLTREGLKIIDEKYKLTRIEIRGERKILRAEKKNFREYKKTLKIEDKIFKKTLRELNEHIKDYRKQIDLLHKDPIIRKLTIHDNEIDRKLNELSRYLRKCKQA